MKEGFAVNVKALGEVGVAVTETYLFALKYDASVGSIPYLLLINISSTSQLLAGVWPTISC